MSSGTGQETTLTIAIERLEVVVRELQGMLGLAETLRDKETKQTTSLPTPAEEKVFTVTNQIVYISLWVEEIHKATQSLLGAIGD